jgi:hypothetical protein
MNKFRIVEYYRNGTPYYVIEKYISERLFVLLCNNKIVPLEDIRNYIRNEYTWDTYDQAINALDDYENNVKAKNKILSSEFKNAVDEYNNVQYTIITDVTPKVQEYMEKSSYIHFKSTSNNTIEYHYIHLYFGDIKQMDEVFVSIEGKKYAHEK